MTYGRDLQGDNDPFVSRLSSWGQVAGLFWLFSDGKKTGIESSLGVHLCQFLVQKPLSVQICTATQNVNMAEGC